MKKIDLNDINLKDYKLISCGMCGTCYFSNDKVLKLFNEFIMSNNKVQNNIESCFGEGNDSYIFPTSLVYKDSLLVGYFTNYINGLSFDKGINDIFLKDIKNSLSKLYLDTKILSYNKIITDDISSKNMMFSKGIKNVDTDFYYKNRSLSVDEIYNINIKNINIALLEYIFNLEEDLSAFEKKCLISSFLFKKFGFNYMDIENECLFLLLMDDINSYACEKLNKENISIKNCNKFFRIRK